MDKGMYEKVQSLLKTVDQRIPISTNYSFRYVYMFKYRGRKYVLKVDDDEPWGNGFCGGEIDCWNEYRDKPEGKVLAPVLMSGEIEDGEGRMWLVMPFLQITPKVCGDRCKVEYLREKILPKLQKVLPEAYWCHDRIHTLEFGDDIHADNVGMDNRGNWFILDYSINGN